MNRVTLRDVARAASVSAATASRALNPRTAPMITEAVAHRVAAAAASLGYRPDPLAAGLRTNRTSTVGVVVPDLANPLFPSIIRGIEAVLEAVGHTAFIADSQNDPARERVIVERLLHRRVDGLILATARRHDPLVAECRASGVPLVLVNRTIDDPAAPAVVGDDAAGMRLAVTHLVGLGHRRIAHLAGPRILSTGAGRQHGFLAAMRDCGLAVEDALIAVAEQFTEAAGRVACRTLLERNAGLTPPITAIVAANDLLAIGCYDELAARGLLCPDDISITGFNDMPFIDRLRPPLTTLRIPQAELGRQAAAALLDRIAGLPAVGLDAVLRLAPELILRGSTRSVVSA